MTGLRGESSSVQTGNAPRGLLARIRSRQAVVGVVGLGHVGLPLAVAFAEAGLPVVGIDTNEMRVASLNAGRSYIPDVASDQLAPLITRSNPVSRAVPVEQEGRLFATTDSSVLGGVDAAIVCVPTPLSKTRDPDLSHILAATDDIARNLHRGMLVVLESTTYPGTTEELVLPRLQQARSLQVGIDFFLAFSPERIDPGRTDWTVNNTPKVIGGVTPACLEVARALYECAVAELMPVSSPRVAEMTKLLENTFRATNIALVNEVAIMCHRLGLDVWEVIEAARTKPFGFMPFYPGPGMGGHCLPSDPQYLAWKLKTLNYHPRFIQLATEINLGMPAYVLDRIAEALNQESKPLKGSKVLLLGVTYKAGVADLRDSPALDLISLLLEKGAKVTYHDPLISQMEVEGLSMTAVKLDEATLRQADCVVITTAHRSYDWPWVLQNSRLIVDTRNATQGLAVESARVVKL